jgi:hypothetical protein
MDWLLGKTEFVPATHFDDARTRNVVQSVVLGIAYCSIAFILGLLTALLIVMGGGVAKWIGLADLEEKAANPAAMEAAKGFWEKAGDIAHSTFSMVDSVFSLALAILLVAGLLRWTFDAFLNLRLARHDRDQARLELGTARQEMLARERAVSLLTKQLSASFAFCAVVAGGLLALVWRGLELADVTRPVVPLLLLACAAMAMLVQSFINSWLNTDGSRQKESGQQGADVHAVSGASGAERDGAAASVVTENKSRT